MATPVQKTPVQKSGDSKLQDAHAAREKNREVTRPSPADLPALLEDSAEKKKAAGQDPSATIAQLMKIVEGLQGQVKSLMSADPKEIMKAKPTFVQCGVCRQATSICRGEHVTAIVMPNDIALWPSFHGVTWNGIKYDGRCILPKVIEQDVLSQVRRWEHNERQKFMPGGKVFSDVRMSDARGGQAQII